jgi:Type II secretory pathway, pseudopilin PulG
MTAELRNCGTAELLSGESNRRLGESKGQGPDVSLRTASKVPGSIRQLRSCAIRQSGLTLVELIVAISILMILTGAAMPIVRVRIQRERETMLRRDLWEMRDAIDRYKDAADRGAFQTKVDSQGYPPDLETLVNGIDVNGKKVRFLRRIPVDPMTGKAEWGMRSPQDDPDSDSFGGQSVFDVYSKSDKTALDGTKYKDW